MQITLRTLRTLLPVLLLAGITSAQCSSRWIAAYGYDQTWRVDRNPRVLADVNGDGRDDVVAFGTYAVEVSLSTGTGFTAPRVWAKEFVYNTGWRVGVHPRYVFDVNKDGKADLVGFGGKGVDVALSTGSGFQTPVTWSEEFGAEDGWVEGRDVRVLVELKQHRTPAIIGIKDRVLRIAAAGSRSFGASSALTKSLPKGTTRVLCMATQESLLSKILPYKVADDILVMGESSAGFEVHRFHLDPYQGWFLHSQPWLAKSQGWDSSKHLFAFADLENDGYLDAVGFGDRDVHTLHQRVQLVDGRHLRSWKAGGSLRDFGYAQGWRIGQHPRFVQDVNGDGRADIVGFGKVASVALSTGPGFRPAVTVCSGFGSNDSWSADRHPRVLADVDRDRRLDIVGFGDKGTIVSAHLCGRPFGAPCSAELRASVDFPDARMSVAVWATRLPSTGLLAQFLAVGVSRVQQPLPPSSCPLLVAPLLVVPTTDGRLTLADSPNVVVPPLVLQWVGLVPAGPGQVGFATSNGVELRL